MFMGYVKASGCKNKKKTSVKHNITAQDTAPSFILLFYIILYNHAFSLNII